MMVRMTSLCGRFLATPLRLYMQSLPHATDVDRATDAESEKGKAKIEGNMTRMHHD